MDDTDFLLLSERTAREAAAEYYRAAVKLINENPDYRDSYDSIILVTRAFLSSISNTITDYLEPITRNEEDLYIRCLWSRYKTTTNMHSYNALKSLMDDFWRCFDRVYSGVYNDYLGKLSERKKAVYRPTY